MHIFRRTLVLFFLGLVYNKNLVAGFSNFLYTGVLQRIAIAYFFSALIVINTSIRKQAIIAGLLLILYWLLMILVPVPGYGAGVITPEGNLHTYIDQLLLPGRLGNGFYDEDGLLQQISSIAVCLAGAIAGHWIRSSFYTKNKRVLGLVGAVLVSIIIALIWNLSFPIIFRLWSSSYAILTIGLSSVLLGLFYWLIDVKGYKKWTFPFVVVGMNSIPIYFLTRFFDFGIIVNVFVHGFIDYLGSFKPLFWALCVLMVQCLFSYLLYKKKIFLKV
ncbi:MAG: acyltransferase family protein [Bacteroidales bacterium]